MEPHQSKKCKKVFGGGGTTSKNARDFQKLQGVLCVESYWLQQVRELFFFIFHFSARGCKVHVILPVGQLVENTQNLENAGSTCPFVLSFFSCVSCTSICRMGQAETWGEKKMNSR